MRVRILSYLGREGFGERFLAEHDGHPCEVRWASESRKDGDETAVARVRDAGLLLQLHPDPLVPRVLAVVPAWEGLAVVAESPGGTPLHDLDVRPLSEPVILEVLRQVAGVLDRVHHRTDPATGEPLRTLHRNVSTECVVLRPDGQLRVTGFDRMTTTWTARAADTGALSMNPGARLAPEQLAGQAFHTTDVYLLGLVAVDLLVNRVRASRFAHQLAMCICDCESFVETRDELLRDPSLDASEGLRDLVADMLGEDPARRPTARQVTERATLLGADAAQLQAFCDRFAPAPTVRGSGHPFVGRTLEVEEHTGSATPPPPVTAEVAASSLLDAPDAQPVITRPAPRAEPPRPVALHAPAAVHAPPVVPADVPHRPRLGNLPPTPPLVDSATPRDRSIIRITAVTPASRRVTPSEAPPPPPEVAGTVMPAHAEVPPARHPPPTDDDAEAALARVRGHGATLGVAVVVVVGILLLLGVIGATAWVASTYFLP